MPLSATVAAGHVYDAFLGADLSNSTLYHGHSYGGNALAAAVALRHLQLLQSRNILGNVRERSEQLRQLLAQLEHLPVVREIRLTGLMGAVVLDTDADALLPRKVCAAMVRRGVLSRSMGNAVTIVPLLTMTAAEIERIVRVLREALDELCA